MLSVFLGYEGIILTHNLRSEGPEVLNQTVGQMTKGMLLLAAGTVKLVRKSSLTAIFSLFPTPGNAGLFLFFKMKETMRRRYFFSKGVHFYCRISGFQAKIETATMRAWERCGLTEHYT